MDSQTDYKKNAYGAVGIFLLVATLYVGMKFISEIRTYGLIGRTEVATVTLSGHGEIQAVPDIANISFTISKDAKTAKEAQDSVAEVEVEALKVLRDNEILDKDIKTTDASFYPKYEYQYVKCTDYGCPPGKNVVVGYTSSESISVKIRNTDNVSTIMDSLSEAGVSNLNGPNFSIDDEDGLKAEARKEAIDDAGAKARTLARDLGVKLGKVVSFSESDNYPVPYYSDMMMSAKAESAPVRAELPKGENTISSDVYITYEIR